MKDHRGAYLTRDTMEQMIRDRDEKLRQKDIEIDNLWNRVMRAEGKYPEKPEYWELPS